MDSCAAKRHGHKVSLGEVRDTNLTGGGRSQVVGKFLQGGGSVNSILWVVNVGPSRVYGKEDRGYAHGFPVNDHGEDSKAIRRWEMGDAGVRRHTRGSGNQVR